MEADITQITGKLPYRLALAGGWIDQPFVSRLNPTPPGSMVVVSVTPTFPFMERCGIGTSTRKVAMRLWDGELPYGEPAELVRQLYDEENAGKMDPSGSQDMAGLVYPGITRLDYAGDYAGGVFPVRVESCTDPAVADWLEGMLYILPIAPRPAQYNPLGIKNLDRDWIRQLGQSGRDCYTAIVAGDLAALGATLNACMACWQAILPHTVVHPNIKTDLLGILRFYQSRYAGAMYSGCGGGYLFVASDEKVPGGIQVKIRTTAQRSADPAAANP